MNTLYGKPDHYNSMKSIYQLFKMIPVRCYCHQVLIVLADDGSVDVYIIYNEDTDQAAASYESTFLQILEVFTLESLENLGNIFSVKFSFLNYNNLNINTSKTFYMVFHRTRIKNVQCYE